MALFNNFPWTNFHELNLDWLIRKVKEIDAAFPEGLVGISKGGTGADNAADARTNLEIAGDTIPFESTIPDQSISEYVGIINDNLNDIADEIAENLNYKIYRSVSSLPNITTGTATILNCWYAMSAGEILIAPHTDFAPSEIPSNYGVVFMVRAAATNGMVRYFGNRTYEMPLVSNAPDGIWRQLRQNSDIIPVESGGTGANNAEDARANLGIDFSGTVLSVCNVGADSAGNIPLKSTDLTNNYESVVDLGLPATGSTISAIWNLLPVNSKIVFPATQTSNAPENANDGYIEMIKGNSGGYILYRSNTNTPGDFRMYLDSDNAPTGTWVTIGGGANDSYKTEYYKQHVFRGVGVAVSTSQVVVSIPIINPDGVTPDIQVNAAGITGLSNISAVVDSARTDRNALTFDLTGQTFTQYRAYNCLVDATLTVPI